MSEWTREEYLGAVDKASQASRAYYTSESVHMDDAEYDALVKKITLAEAAHPEWTLGHSPTQVVGAGGGEVRHATKMLSLDNVFSIDELKTWMAGAGENLEWVIEPKLDGLAVAVTYRDGQAVRLATRGDGESGEDVTYALANIEGLGSIPGYNGEIRGEVVLTHKQLESANELRIEHGDKPFANARNGAAGALRGQDRDYDIAMTFFAYGSAEQDRDHHDTLAMLREGGFTLAFDLLEEHSDVLEAATWLGANRATLGVDTDGAVIKVNSARKRKEMGASARAPRWAIALKYPADTVFSVLREVSWQVGRTGVITPRAHIDPVSVGGVTVSYATLHNPADIARKGFLLGDTVSVYRAGEVVPRVEAPLTDRRDGTQRAIELPTQCPECGSALDTSEVRWRCSRGRGCSAARNLEYACSRDALDIEGLGSKHIATLVEQGLVKDVADLFDLRADDLADLDRLGQTSAGKIIEQVDRARTATLGRVITALGIRGTGRALSRRLAEQFPNLEAFMNASEEQLMAVEGIGEEKAVLIHSELGEVRDVAERLISAGIGMVSEVRAKKDNLPLAGKKVCVSGSVPGMSRNEANEAVELLGGKSVGSVSKATDLLVAGPGAGSKSTKAAELGVEIMDSEDFAQLVKDNS